MDIQPMTAEQVGDYQSQELLRQFEMAVLDSENPEAPADQQQNARTNVALLRSELLKRLGV